MCMDMSVKPTKVHHYLPIWVSMVINLLFLYVVSNDISFDEMK
jgi:hypothetical protein